jgi:conjugal transfer pilus assembly protein TraV
MNIFHLTTLAALVVLTGCSTTAQPGNYECPLHDTAAAKCASVSQAFKAAQAIGTSDVPGRQSVFERSAPPTATASNQAPIVGAQSSGYPDVGETGMPVFSQPKVLRVWVAPYVDANGNLRSGEYTYFSTPGQWNYGDLKKVGSAAAGMFGPAQDKNLGYTPAAPAQTTAARPAPPAPADVGRLVAPITPAATNAPTVQGAAPSAPSITQPYQRLVGN